MPEPIQVAIIGAGIFAKECHLPTILNFPEQYHLKAIYSRSQKSAQELADLIPSTYTHGTPAVYHDVPESTERSLDALLTRKDIEAVTVCLPIAMQPAVVGRALKAGKHVLSEKPVSATVADGYQAIKQHQETCSKLIWNVAENWRCEDAVDYAATLCRDLGHGAVRTFALTCLREQREENKYVQTGWRTGKGSTVPGGFLLDGGVHWVAALRAVIGVGDGEKPGWTIDRVNAFGNLWQEYCAPMDSLNAIAQLTRTGSDIELHQRPNGTITINFASSGQPSETTLKVICETGTVHLTQQVDPSSRHFRVWFTSVGGAVSAEKTFPYKGVENEFKVFGQSIRTRKPKHVSEIASYLSNATGQYGQLNALEALVDVAVIEACLKSAEKNGESVSVHDLLKNAAA
ncbi:hypothetical protein DFS34DRAFT_15811 [Phlyctochytrium arcticum]|nr:hypothetical protein DFS34DRAFT_15811 [Phlyctochytrium arcticum]